MGNLVRPVVGAKIVKLAVAADGKFLGQEIGAPKAALGKVVAVNPGNADVPQAEVIRLHHLTAYESEKSME